MSVIEDLTKEYYRILEEADERTKDWLWMQTPIPTVIIMIAYVLVIYFGPKIMKNREPFKFKNLLVIYNFVLVVLSAHITFEVVLVGLIYERFNLFCQPIDLSPTEHGIRLCAVGWWFYISKLVELFDTVFFVLRKKNNQISFLHCYHHLTMTLISWSGIKFIGGGSSFLFPMFNSFVHIFMYTYYGLAAMGPSMQKYLWWKKYMTKLQLLQLVGIVFFLVGGLTRDCGFPKIVNKVVTAYVGSLVILFGNFYYKAYIARNHRTTTSNGLKHNENGIKSMNGVAHVQNGELHQNGKIKNQ